MAIYTHHAKRAKDCVVCKFWIYEASTRGKCTKRNDSATPACCFCPNYVPSPEAEKLL